MAVFGIEPYSEGLAYAQTVEAAELDDSALQVDELLS